ncbi:MAG: glycosyltransferase family 2 protein [Balneolaceae bacterium]|nr:glycosyltransferase family 2 protein [Balneolaceae bacterium]
MKPASVSMMELPAYTLMLYSILAGIVWIAGYAFIVRQLYSAPKISEMDAPEPQRYPSLSILVPACNEEESIEPALRSLLEQEYPVLEIIAIDDRSKDSTGEIIDRLSEEYQNLKPLHIEKLPEGWIGKTNALKEGFKASEGEWILTTDADVCYNEKALLKIIAVALYQNLDHVSCLPNMHNNGFLHEMTYNAFLSFVAGVQNMEGVQDVDSDDYFAFGAFNMFRREVFDKSKGFSWLRMEIVDDMGIGKLLRDAGARQGFFYAFDELELEWYGSLTSMIEGLEKNGIAVLAHYNYLRGIAIPIIWAIIFFGPVSGLFSAFLPVLLFSAAAIISTVPFNIAIARRLKRPVSTYLFSIFGVWIMNYALLRSVFMCAKRGGVEWRGVTYPVKKLRKYQRVKF